MAGKFEFNPDLDLKATLSAAQEAEQRVKVHLNQGTPLEGFVKAMGMSAIVITKLTDRNFSDAYVPISSIVAVESRVRGD